VQPDAVDLWQVLLTATEASASAAGDLASLQALMPVLLGDRGEVQGVKGRVAEMISAAPDTKGSSRYCRALLLDWVTPQTPQLTPMSPLYRYCRPEDAGALLFMSSNMAIKATGERVREAKALLEGLIVSFEERDVFINHECAARNSGEILTQCWRNSGAIVARFCAISLTRLLLYSGTPTSSAASRARRAATVRRRRCPSYRSSTSTASGSARSLR